MAAPKTEPPYRKQANMSHCERSEAISPHNDGDPLGWPEACLGFLWLGPGPSHKNAIGGIIWSLYLV